MKDTKDITVKLGWLERFVTFTVRRRVPMVIAIGILTVFTSYFAFHVEVKTIFTDLLPWKHPYIKVNERFKQTFGGSNMVSIMVETEKGDIFNPVFLARVQKITNDLQFVTGVNPFQIISLASKKLKEVRASTEGIETIPLMWPNLPRDEVEMAHLREAVLKNPLVYGPYVSPELKATLITVDFYEQLIDYPKIFKQIRSIVESVEGDGVNVRVVGEPMLYGWVHYYLPETVKIIIITTISVILVLFLFGRTWRGVLLPLLTGIISSLTALGAARLLGFQLEPLIIVIAFLITARDLSHSVQFVTHFDDEMAAGKETPAAAARATLLTLFRPAMLSIVADAGCMIIVSLTPIPLLEKVGILGTIWLSNTAFSAVVLIPVLLSWVRVPKGYAHPIDVSPLLRKFLGLAIRLAHSPRGRSVVLVVTIVIFIVSGLTAFRLKVGDANPGSPILWSNSEYNKDAAVINGQFPGADRMFVVVAGERGDTLKEPAVMDNIELLQEFMEAQPEVGGSLSLADVVPVVKRQLHEGNPRYEEVGKNAVENGEILHMYISGTEPGDMDRYCDPHYWNGVVNLYFRDHKGDTIRTAVARVKEFAEKHPMPGAKFELAGGLIGVLAAVNEVILGGQIEAIALGLLVVIGCCLVTYRSLTSGLFFMIPVVISNTLTFSYMAAKGIGMNINTLPVVALGIGLGIDYTFYIIDGIRENLREHGDMDKAVTKSLSSQGKGVLVTVFTLSVSIFWWCFSSLRFQAEMGILIAIWITISALSAFFVMPALAYIFRPAFIVGKGNRFQEGR